MSEVKAPREMSVHLHAINQDVLVDLTSLSQVGLDVIIERGLAVMYSNSFIGAVREATKEDPQPNNGASYGACSPEEKTEAKRFFFAEIVPALNDKINRGEYQVSKKSNPNAVAAGLFKRLFKKEPSKDELSDFMASDIWVEGQKEIAATREEALKATRRQRRATDLVILGYEVQVAIDGGLPLEAAILKVVQTTTAVKKAGELASDLREKMGG